MGTHVLCSSWETVPVAGDGMTPLADSIATTTRARGEKG